MRVTIQNKVRDLRDPLGEGGEARVFKTKLDGCVLPCAAKIYKGPKDPDYAGPEVQDQRNRDGAERRLRLCQEKLLAFPKPQFVPKNVIGPRELIYDAQGKDVVGYLMDMIPEPRTVLRRWSEKPFRDAGVDTNHVIEAFRVLHKTVLDLHGAGVVIGDNNDLNVLVGAKPEQVFLIDTDSFQFGKFLCSSFTQRFADPRLCDPTANRLLLTRPHDVLSDWYAYAIMLFQSLLYVTPYDGVYKPKGKPAVPHDARPLKGLSIFDPDVRTPKFAPPVTVLPDELQKYFADTFSAKQHRQEFPTKLLRDLRWTKCAKCGAEHARGKCPQCQAAGPVVSTTEYRGAVTCTVQVKLSGPIVCATSELGKLKYVMYEPGNGYYREDHRLVLAAPQDPKLRWRIGGDMTYAARGETLHSFEPGKLLGLSFTDSFQGAIPSYDANHAWVFRIDNGRLTRKAHDAPFDREVRVGDVLANNTLFWAGPSFGFGFYRALELSEFFVFGAESQNPALLKDGVPVPRLKGQVYDATCVFGSKVCWFLASYQSGSQMLNRCTVVNDYGEVLGHEEATQGDGSWLGTLRGKCAVGSSLFAITDDGLVRVGITAGGLEVSKSFPDTEPFVESTMQLFPAKDGLYTVSQNEIRLLRMQ